MPDLVRSFFRPPSVVYYGLVIKSSVIMPPSEGLLTMVMFPSGSGKLKLVKNTRRYFSSLGWNVNARGSEQDLGIRKGDLLFKLYCLDRGTLEFLSQEEVLVRLRSVSFGGGVDRSSIGIINFEFPVMISDRLVSMGLSLVHVSNLSVISNLDRLHHELPDSLDEQQLLLCRGNTSFCLNVASRFQGQGDLLNAVRWAELAISGNNRHLPAHFRLVRIHQEAGSIKAMKDVATVALGIDPSALVFVKALLHVAEKEGNTDEVAELKIRVKEVIKNETLRPTFESILMKQSILSRNQSQNPQPARTDISGLGGERRTWWRSWRKTET